MPMVPSSASLSYMSWGRTVVFSSSQWTYSGVMFRLQNSRYVSRI